MNFDRLRQLFGAYGAEPSRWPADERDEAIHLAAVAEPADAQAERALDRLLDAWAVDAASLDLRQRIFAQTPRMAHSAWRSVGLWVQGAALAAACAAGLLAGLSLARVDYSGRTGDRDTDTVAATTYDAGTIATTPADSETT
jgi:hypothetical protein